MTNLAMGANAPIASPAFTIEVRIPQGAQMDVSALQLYADGKVRGDSDMCFFNQPVIGAGAISLSTSNNVQSYSLDLDKVGADVEKIVINVTMDSAPLNTIADLNVSTTLGIDMLVETSGRSETALILCEIYKRNGQWKIRNVSQGFNGGLQALAEHFGVEVATPADAAANPVSAPAPATPAPATPAPAPPAPAPPAPAPPAPAPSASPAPTPAAPTPPTPPPTATPASPRESTSPALLNRLKQTADKARSKLSSEASKFKNRAFMEAVVNGCVLVAAADGDIDASEKQKMAGFIERSNELKHFEMREVIDVFQKAAASFELDSALGKAAALKKIGSIKANEEQSRLLVRVVCAIGAADGEFDNDEKAVVAEIARELGLNPADFDL